MKTVTVLVLGLAMVLSAVPMRAQDAPDAAGTWAVTVMGMTFNVILMVDGSDVYGTLQGPMGDLDLTGKIDGPKVTFMATVSVNGNQFDVNFSGTIDKDAMKGTVDFGGQGGADFTATRKQ